MRTIPDRDFTDDDGGAEPAVAAALAQVARGARLEVAVAGLCGARVLVPVVSMPGEIGYDELAGAHDKRTEMAAVLLTGKDGRTALLAFSCLTAMRAWDAAARPVPVTISQAAQAALDQGADALVVDVAGPAQVPIESGALRHVAQGHDLVSTTDGWAWVTVGVQADGSTGPV